MDMDSLYKEAAKVPGFMENFQKWREKNCPLVIAGDGIGNCNQCLYGTCEEFFKEIIKNKEKTHKFS